MTQRNWEDEYERILRDGLQSGKVSVLPSSSEKRRHPRFRLRSGTIFIKEDHPFEVINLSRSGLAFYGVREFKEDERISISLHQLMAIEAVVVGCDMEETDSNLMEYRYRVRCRFLNDDYGLQFLVMALEMEQGVFQIEILR
jgi:hypothetical protein